MPVTHLFVGEPAGTEIAVTWRATATNADGVVSGELSFTVTDALNLGALLPPHG
jgi:hypothetical protein